MTKNMDKLYVRVSTKYESQQDSPEHQESFIRETASREGVEFGGDDVYLDRDTATTIVDREDVRRMIDDAQRGAIRSIWFASLSRFSRDAIDAISLKRILVNALKIRVVSIEDGYDSARKDDEFLFGIKAVVNQNTSGDIGTSSRRGIRASAAAGNYIGSIPPYGYRKVVVDDLRMKSGKRKTLEVIPDQAEIVRMIFDLYVNQGMGEKSIVNYLNGENEKGVATPSYRGGLWGLSSVQRILQNENYTGYNVYGRHTVEVTYNDLSNLMNRGKKLVQKPKSEWSRTTFQTHEAIITLEMFERMQEIRLQRGGGERGGRRAYVNVFAKMIFCAECGSAMVTMNSKTKIGSGKEYRYLMCSRRRRMGDPGCSNAKWIPYAEIRDELMNEIVNRLRASLDAHPDAARLRSPNTDNEKEKRKLEKRVADNRKLLFEIRRQNMLGELDNMQYEYERDQYEKEIAESDKKLAMIISEERRVLDIDRIRKETVTVLRKLTSLSSYDDVESTRPLLLLCVRKISINKDGEVTIETYI
jgi:site-specific DNA recombinase